MEPVLPPQAAQPVAQPTPPPSPVPPPTPPAPPRKSHKKLALTVVIVLFIAVASAMGYYLYTMMKPKSSQATQTPAVASITVPKEAIVTAECTEGRGKQYIMTKDIPDGPIYDVVDGKVVAIEYLVGLSELISKPEDFKDLMLEKGQYDHLALMPVNPHAGMAEQHFHAIAYLISPEQAKSITCKAGAANSTMDMTTHH